MINTKILGNLSADLHIICPRCNYEYPDALTNYDWFCPQCELEFTISCEVKTIWKDGQKDARKVTA